MSRQRVAWNLNLSVLRQCDIYRDGGSWEAVFTDSNDQIVYLWLSRHPKWSDVGYKGPRHQHLFVDNDVPIQAGRTGVPVWSCSDEEGLLIRAFERFVEDPRIDVPFAHRTPKGEFLKLANRMLEAIKGREECVPSSDEESKLAIRY